MVIKVNGYELNITKDHDVYVGGTNCGQMFINWGDLDAGEKAMLEKIEKKALSLILQSEQALTPTKQCAA